MNPLVTDALWERIAPLLPPPRRRFRFFTIFAEALANPYDCIWVDFAGAAGAMPQERGYEQGYKPGRRVTLPAHPNAGYLVRLVSRSPVTV